MLVPFSMLKELELPGLRLLEDDAWWRLGGRRVLPVHHIIINPANRVGQSEILAAERARHRRHVKQQRHSGGRVQTSVVEEGNSIEGRDTVA